MTEPRRIFLRLLGLVLFVGSVAGMASILVVGPDQIAEGMGKNCRHGSGTGPSDWCRWQDVLDMMQALPFVCLIGGALLLTMGKGAFDRPVRGPQKIGIATWVGALSVVIVVAASFPTVFVYRAGYTAVELKEVHDKIRRETRAPFEKRTAATPEPRTAAPQRAPRGLGRGSLLRPARFRAALGELRRAAPAGARLTRLRVAADRIDAEVVGRGRLVTLRKAWNAKAGVVSSETATGADEPLITFARVDPAAPRRVAVAAARSAGARPRDVDYLILQDVVGLRWSGFLAGGRGPVSASPDGRQVLSA